MNQAANLPSMLSLHIFSYLEEQELAMCSGVCQSWRKLANYDALWTILAKQVFNGSIPRPPNIPQFLQHFSLPMITSNEVLVRRVQAFVGNLHSGQNARFTCVIKTGETFGTILIEIKTPQKGFPNNLEEHCVANYDFWQGSSTLPSPDAPPCAAEWSTLDAGGGQKYVVRAGKQLPHALVRFPILPMEDGFGVQDRIQQILAIKIDELDQRRDCVVS